MFLYRRYRKLSSVSEQCFYIECDWPLTTEELEILSWLLAETFEPEQLGEETFLDGPVIEIGPRLNFATAFSTNAVSICHACGLAKVTRLECSRRLLTSGPAVFDRMTETVYPEPLARFGVDATPETVFAVPILEEGPDAMRRINKKLGLGMDEADIALYTRLFAERIGRNPTNVEAFGLGQANSEHSRHWLMNGKLVIDGEVVPETLFQIVRAPLRARPNGSVIAFRDNSSAIVGWMIETLVPETPGTLSRFITDLGLYHPVFTAETHNFPTGKAPRPGAETGTGGRIRDVEAVGRGGLVGAGTLGYCTGNPNIPGYRIPGEDPTLPLSRDQATPLDILIQASNGASDYGNKFGEPVIAGFCRTLDMKVHAARERRAWLKPILFTGGVGTMRDAHVKKNEPEVGMAVVMIGGPAYRIGVGGGGASSMIAGANDATLDFNAVQRGDAEMERKMDRVIRTCIELGEDNPIESIHDQGAGGPCNVLTELVHPAGGRIEIRNINSADRTMSVLELWSAEYQERNALLIRRENLARFQAICAREKIACEVLGEITGDGRIVLHDAVDDSTPVDLTLADILGELPQKTYEDTRLPPALLPLVLPDRPIKVLLIGELVQNLLRLPSVGSKGWLVRKVDRSVTGLVARQPCCGPLQLPVSDVGVHAATMLSYAPPGTATSIGERPIPMLVDVRAGARLAVGEAITNICAAVLRDGLSGISSSTNEMWAAKMPGEIANLYDMLDAMRTFMITIGIVTDGGKDSMSMAAKVDGTIVKAPGQLVVSLYAAMTDVRQVATPDLKRPGSSHLLFIDFGSGKNRLGGSALAQSLGQIGDDCPDVDDPQLLVRAFNAVQGLIRDGIALSYHDKGDGGLVTTLAEMAMSGACGLTATVPADLDPVSFLFNEELGMVIEVADERLEEARTRLTENNVPHSVIARTTEEETFVLRQVGERLLVLSTMTLLQWWEATSDAFERLQMNPALADEQAASHRERVPPPYHLTFSPERTLPHLMVDPNRPKVAIIREEGSNGDREMAAAFYLAGFDTFDINMTDLANGEVTQLDAYHGVAYVGGFSNADALDSAKGWAGTIRFNPTLQRTFERFYARPDTFSLGVCNGCQLMALMGVVPWTDIPDADQPRFIHNASGRFESRWTTVRIDESPAIMLRGMAGSIFGVPASHGEGRLHASWDMIRQIREQQLAPIVYVDDLGSATTRYPWNPNGSPHGIAALCDRTGRHLAWMLHPERAFQPWQCHWLPEEYKGLEVSPWLRMFQNARVWCSQP